MLLLLVFPSIEGLANGDSLNKALISDGSVNKSSTLVQGEVNIFFEDFSDGFEDDWHIWEQSPNHEIYWGFTNYSPLGDGHSYAWCAGGGADGLDPASGHYANNMSAWMRYGPN